MTLDELIEELKRFRTNYTGSLPVVIRWGVDELETITRVYSGSTMEHPAVTVISSQK